jgi:type VI secretion system secreted protein VgrG
VAAGSQLCPNNLNPSTGTPNDLAWNTATGDTPWSAQCTAALQAPVITSGVPPGGVVGATYAFQVTATGSAPITFTATGLPAGLAIDPNTGLISGTPTTVTAGPVSVTITASNGATLPNGTPANATQTFTMAILPPPAVPTAPPTPVPMLSPLALASLSGVLGFFGLRRRGNKRGATTGP